MRISSVINGAVSLLQDTCPESLAILFRDVIVGGKIKAQVINLASSKKHILNSFFSVSQ
jgi:hypothetical protein